jgi:hypothetical protein
MPLTSLMRKRKRKGEEKEFLNTGDQRSEQWSRHEQKAIHQKRRRPPVPIFLFFASEWSYWAMFLVQFATQKQNNESISFELF